MEEKKRKKVKRKIPEIIDNIVKEKIKKPYVNKTIYNTDKPRCQAFLSSKKQCRKEAVIKFDTKFKYCLKHLKTHAPSDYVKVVGFTENETQKIDDEFKNIVQIKKDKWSFSKKFWDKLQTDLDLINLDADELFNCEQEIKIITSFIDFFVQNNSEKELLRKSRTFIEMIDASSRIKERHAKIVHGETQSLHLTTFNLLIKNIFMNVFECFGKDKEAMRLFLNKMRDLSDIIRDTGILDGKPIRDLEKIKSLKES